MTHKDGMCSSWSIITDSTTTHKAKPTEQDFAYEQFLEDANRFMDGGMKAVFTIGTILSGLSTIKQGLIAAGSVTIYGYLWNYFDALGGIFSAEQTFNNAFFSARHHREKVAIAATEMVAAGNLIVCTALTAAAQGQLVTGSAALFFSPLGGIAFALCMWHSAIKSAIGLHRAIQKTDPQYLLEDRLKKYHNLNDLLCLELSDEERKRILKKRDKLSSQAYSLALFCYTNTEDINKDDALTKINQRLQSVSLPTLSANQTMTCTQQSIVTLLINKQKQKVVDRSIATAAWYCAAAGMTLIALSPFCPFLLLPGIILSGVASVIKIYEVYRNKTATKRNIASIKKMWEAKLEAQADKVSLDYHGEQIMLPDEAMSQDKRIDYFMANIVMCCDHASEPQYTSESLYRHLSILEKSEPKQYRLFIHSVQKRFAAKEMAILNSDSGLLNPESHVMQMSPAEATTSMVA